MTMKQPQLRMEIVGLAGFDGESAALTLPAGYHLRTLRPGDEAHWLALLQAGEFTHWDRERLGLMLANEHVLTPWDGIFFATDTDDRPIGTACTQIHPGPDGLVGAELGWVVVAPEHRGHGLGRVVCRAVLGFIGRRGYDRAFLRTDDFRLPAIQTYLTLGFQPALVDPSHPARWDAVHQLLAARGPA
jgi:mycothiol synthase